MGTPEISLTAEQAEFAQRMANGLSCRELYDAGLDKELLLRKYYDRIRPIRGEISSYEPLHKQRNKAVETEAAWAKLIEGIRRVHDGILGARCIRLTSQGIGIYKDGELQFAVLVFMEPNNRWITVESYPKADEFWRHGWVVIHDSLEYLIEWSESLVGRYGRFDLDGETFVFKLAQLLDDLLRKLIDRKRESLRAVEAAEIGAQHDNIRYTGYLYMSAGHESAIRNRQTD